MEGEIRKDKFSLGPNRHSYRLTRGRSSARKERKERSGYKTRGPHEFGWMVILPGSEFVQILLAMTVYGTDYERGSKLDGAMFQKVNHIH